MKGYSRVGVAVLAAASLLMLVLAGPSAGHGQKPKPKPRPLTEKAILFAADGMRPDLVERYADAGRDADV